MPIGWNSGNGSSSDSDVTSVNGKTGDVTISKSSLGLGNVDNTADADKPVSDDTQTAIDSVSTTMTTQVALCLKKAQLGVSGGVASLDTNGALTEEQIPESLLSGLKWQSGWDADSDSPTLPDASEDTVGYFYKVTTAGTHDSVTYAVGDWVIGSSSTSDGTTTYLWSQVPSTTESATTTSEGTIQLAGDLGGGATAPTVESIQGITVPSTTPESGNFIVASSTEALEYRDITADDLPEASTTAEGILQLTQDLAGTHDAPLVEGLQGYTIDNDPSVGVDYVLGVSNLTDKTLTWIAQTGGSGVTASYMQVKLDSTQSSDISAGDHIKFADEVISVGSNISLDTSGTYSSSSTTSNVGRFTLSAGRTYRMVANTGKLTFSSTTEDSSALLQWYDVTNSKALGTSTTSYAVTSTSAVSSSGTTETIYKATTEVIVELRIISATNLSSINGDYDTSHDCASALIYVVAGDVAITGQSVDYSLGYLATTTTLTSGDDIIFDTISGNLDYETSSGCWTLNSGTTYQLSFNGQFNSFTDTDSGVLQIQWVDADNNALSDGGLMIVVPQESTTSNSSNPSTNIVYIPTVDIAVKLRVISSTGSASLEANQNSVIIKQLGTSSVSTMTGASSTADGTEGTVPAPDIGDQDYTLHGDATWRLPYSTIVQDSSKNLTIGSSGDSLTATLYRDVGIGTVPETDLHIYAGSSGASVLNTYTHIFSENSTHNYMQMSAGLGYTSGIYFGNSYDPDGGFILYYGHASSTSSSYLYLGAGSSATLYINNDNVGINTVPETDFHIYSGNSGASIYSTDVNVFIEDSANNYLQMSAGTSSYAGLLFTDSTTSNYGYLKYYNSNNYMYLGTNGSNRLTITSSGYVGINDITPSYNLDVSGAIRATSGYIGSSSANGTAYLGGKVSGYGMISLSSSKSAYISFSVPAGTWTVTIKFTIANTGMASSYYYLDINTSANTYDTYSSVIIRDYAAVYESLVNTQVFTLTATDTIYGNWKSTANSISGLIYYTYFLGRIG